MDPVRIAAIGVATAGVGYYCPYPRVYATAMTAFALYYEWDYHYPDPHWTRKGIAFGSVATLLMRRSGSLISNILLLGFNYWALG